MSKSKATDVAGIQPTDAERSGPAQTRVVTCAGDVPPLCVIPHANVSAYIPFDGLKWSNNNTKIDKVEIEAK